MFQATAGTLFFSAVSRAKPAASGVQWRCLACESPCGVIGEHCLQRGRSVCAKACHTADDAASDTISHPGSYVLSSE